MSHDDPYRHDGSRDGGRGAYTPPDEDDLPFDRQSYDARRGGGYGRGAPIGGGGKAPPMTLIVSAVLLLGLIVAVVVFYRAGLRSSTDAPPAVGTPVPQMKVEAPIDAQPIDPEAGIDVYRAPESVDAVPTYTPPPEAVQPRPAPRPIDAAPLPAPAKPAPATPAPAAPATPAPEKAAPAPATGGTAGVQIGAFSTPSIADREFSAVTSRYAALTRGATKRVQEVTASNGSTVYRTTVTGLSRDQAQRLCAAIRADGDDCFVR